MIHLTYQYDTNMIFLFWGPKAMTEFSRQHKVSLTSTYTQNHANQKQNYATKAYFLKFVHEATTIYMTQKAIAIYNMMHYHSLKTNV